MQCFTRRIDQQRKRPCHEERSLSSESQTARVITLQTRLIQRPRKSFQDNDIDKSWIVCMNPNWIEEPWNCGSSQIRHNPSQKSSMHIVFIDAMRRSPTMLVWKANAAETLAATNMTAQGMMFVQADLLMNVHPGFRNAAATCRLERFPLPLGEKLSRIWACHHDMPCLSMQAINAFFCTKVPQSPWYSLFLHMWKLRFRLRTVWWAGWWGAGVLYVVRWLAEFNLDHGISKLLQIGILMEAEKMPIYIAQWFIEFLNGKLRLHQRCLATTG